MLTGLQTVTYSEFVLIMINVGLGILMAVGIKISFLGYGTSTVKMGLLGSSEAPASV